MRLTMQILHATCSTQPEFQVSGEKIVYRISDTPNLAKDHPTAT